MIQFLGDSDLTDYHSPLGTDIDGPVEILANHDRREPCLSISILFPARPPTPVGREPDAGPGSVPRCRSRPSPGCWQLPSSVDEYYVMIGKKERHELRRKRRRYEDQVGPATLCTDVGAGFGFDEFVRLHRLAPGTRAAS